MNTNVNYPEYLTFNSLNQRPTAVSQFFEKEVILEEGKRFYPKIEKLEGYFNNDYQSLKFGACQFIGFLHDTIHVEHNIVIPCIKNLYKLPFDIPDEPKEELFKLVTDEGHHAAQALTFIHAIQDKFAVDICERGKETPLFMTKLEESERKLVSENDKVLFKMIIGVVTETRISKELGQFTRDNDIVSSVVNCCRSHQEDEIVHASQFRALGIWCWSKLNEHQRNLAAGIFAETTIMRSLPDTERLAFYFSLATGCLRTEADEVINNIFTEDVMKQDMLIAARPTLSFLKKMGVTEYPSAKQLFIEYGITV